MAPLVFAVGCGKSSTAVVPVDSTNGSLDNAGGDSSGASGDSSASDSSTNNGLSTADKSIVIVGDSHSCGSFGSELVKSLKKKSYSITLYCAVSSTPTNWVNGTKPSGQVCQTMTSSKPTLQLCSGTGNVPKFATILAAHPTSLFLIAHGTNSLLSTSVDANYKKMAQMISAQKNSCVWVGPPHLRPDQAKGFTPSRLTTMEGNLADFYSSLDKSVSSACELIDSRHFTAKGTAGYSTADGVHRTTAAGIYWADQLVDDVF